MTDYSSEELERWLLAKLSGRPGRRPGAAATTEFAVLGLRSVEAVRLVAELSELLDRPLSESVLYDRPTPRALARWLCGSAAGAPRAPHPVGDTGPGLAVTGLACRFPGGADTPAAFWELLLAGGDTVTAAPSERWSSTGVEAPAGFRGAFLDDIAGWDPEFFGLSPNEALRLDPQHRLLGEVVWEALEDAGQAPDRLAGSRTGIFAGLMDSHHYARLQRELDPAAASDPSFGLGTSVATAAGRLAHLLDLRGPALVVDTACSSALVAMHLAVRALQAGDCDLAVVGGASLVCHPQVYETARCMSMLAADGRCKTFDAAADGFVLGEGAAAVVLQRLPDAARDRRRVRAVLRGSAVNQDGRSNGLTAPNRSAQVAVLRDALRAAEVEPADVAFVETHGSGTRLGDTVELDALQEVFAGRPAAAPVWTGAVKTNVGHLLAAAGLAGFLKAVLAVEHRLLPGNRNLVEPTPALARTPALRPPATAQVLLPRAGSDVVLAGVSSFGWSGTNAHAVLAEAPAVPGAPVTGPVVLPLSAADPERLRALAGALAAHLAEHEHVEPADVARTLCEGRNRWRFRRALVCQDRADAVRRLTELSTPDAPVTEAVDSPTVVFDFPADTGLPAGALRRLYTGEPVFRDAVDAHLAGASAEVVSLWRTPADGSPSAAAQREFARGAQHALAATLRAWGCPPSAETGRPAPTAPLPGDVIVVRFGVGGPDTAEGDPIDLAGLDGATTGRAALLGLVARLWEAGHEPDWVACGGTDGHIVSLPHTLFRRRPLWPGSEPGRRPPEDWCHIPAWPPAPVPAEPLAPGTTVLFTDEHGLGAALGHALAGAGERVLTVRPGAAGDRTAGRAVLDPEDAAQHRQLLAGLAGPVRIVHLWSLRAAADDPEAALRWGFHSLRLLAQAIGVVFTRQPVSLLVVTRGAHGVDGRAVAPLQATAIGLCQVLGQEYEWLRCRGIDLDPAANPATGPAVDAGRLRDELAALDSAAEVAEVAEVGTGPAVAAWRDGRRRVRDWVPARPDPAGPTRWRPDGTYLITGGTRGLGLALARQLARSGSPRLVLVARTPLPERSRWPELARRGTDRIARTVRDLLELEEKGAIVHPVVADVGDPAQVRRAVAQARERFGALHGVVHAAGVPGSGLVQGMSRAAAEHVLRPKVHGTLALLAELPRLELLVLYSSAVTALGGVGEGDYCAANAFLDACATAARGPARVVSVAWGPWQHDDWTRGDTASTAAVAGYRARYGIGAEEGPTLLTRILSTPWPQVLVLPQPPARTRQWWADLGGSRRGAAASVPAGPAHPRPRLRSPYVEPHPGLERRIALLWQECLGIDRVGSADPFFDLGGNSLIGLTVTERLTTELAMEVPPAMLFAHPTVRELARALGGTPEAGTPAGTGRGSRGQARAAAAARRRRSR